MTTKLTLPAKGRITSGYGKRVHPITKKESFHNGIDIALPSGTKLLAPRSGKVVSTYYTTTGGNQMIVQFDNGYKMGMAHLTESKFSKDQEFSKGDVLALSGNTGASTGAHLHLTLRINEELVNPADHFII